MVGARIRVDFYGYVAPGDPALAAELAFRDASVSHVKNGVYSAMYVAAMIAAAAVCGDPETIVAAGLEQIPLNCRHRAGMEQVLAWYREGRSAEQTIEAIHSLYDENRFFGWCSAISNDMVCTAALLYGAGDFGRSICLTVQAAYDTDSNGATVGSIAGIMCGKSGIDLCWTQPYGDRLHTLVQDYAEVTVDTLVERTQAVIDARAR